jgi:hypothetical protein
MITDEMGMIREEWECYKVRMDGVIMFHNENNNNIS